MKHLSVVIGAGALLAFAGCKSSQDEGLGTKQSAVTVGVTQGFIAGTITFDADFVPDTMNVDAGDITPPHFFVSHGTAQLQGSSSPSPGRIISTWTYNLPVEAAAANTYRVRPVAFITALNERAPFPDSDDVGVSPGNTSQKDINYRPVVLTGQVALSDLQNNSLPQRSFFLSAFDSTGAASEVIQPDCVGSIAFCASAAQVAAPVAGSYELYLKPGHSYQLNPQAVSVNEDPNLFGTQAYNAIQFNDGESLTAPAAAVNPTDPTPTVHKDYVLTELAEVSGQLNLTTPAGWTVYGKGVTLSGTSTLGLDYADEFFPSPFNPSPTYITRAFNVLDATKPVVLTPNFILSADSTGYLGFPAQQITLNTGVVNTVDFSGSAGVIQGSFTFSPPYQVKNTYPYVQVQTQSRGLTRNSFVPDANNGASYQLLAFADDWTFWSFGWDFNLGDPNFSSTYQIFVNPLADVKVAGLGDAETQNFKFNVDLVKVYFTAPDASGLSDPQLTAVAPSIIESGHGAGYNQSNVSTGEARILLRVPTTPTTFQITPSATIHGAVVNFSPITLTPAPGNTYVIGTPGNIILSVTSPQPNQSSTTCQYTLTGTAGGIPITAISVNGQPVSFTAAPSATDPNQVSFSMPVTNTTGSLSVTATGKSLGQTYQVTDVVPIICLNRPPTITSCPAPVNTPCGSSAGGTRTLQVGATDPDGDPLSVTWTVDGTARATDSLASGTTSDSFTYTYPLGAHQVSILVSDGRGGTDSCMTTVTVQDPTGPAVKATVATGMLWPPNHDLVNVGLAVSDKDTCDPSPQLTLQVYSNEGDQSETGTGNFSPDAKDIASGTLRLRSERDATGKGRVFLIIASGTNSSGELGTDCAAVVVPHDQSAAAIATVNSMASAAVATCRQTGAAPAGYVLVGNGPTVGPKQ